MVHRAATVFSGRAQGTPGMWPCQRGPDRKARGSSAAPGPWYLLVHGVSWRPPCFLRGDRGVSGDQGCPVRSLQLPSSASGMATPPPRTNTPQPAHPELPEPVDEEKDEDDEEEDNDCCEANEPGLQHFGASVCTARNGDSFRGAPSCSGWTPHPTPQSPRHSPPPAHHLSSATRQGQSVPRRAQGQQGALRAAGGCPHISLLCPQSGRCQGTGADWSDWGWAVWGHLPSCPQAVAVSTSRIRSERGCQVLSIFGGRSAKGCSTLDPAPQCGSSTTADDGQVRALLCAPGAKGRLLLHSRGQVPPTPQQRGSWGGGTGTGAAMGLWVLGSSMGG